MEEYRYEDAGIESASAEQLNNEETITPEPSVRTMRRAVNHIFFWLLLYNVLTLILALVIGEVFDCHDEFLLSIITTVAGTALIYLCTFKKWPVRPFARGTKKMTLEDFAIVFGAFGLTQIITLCVNIITTAMGIEGTSIDLGEVTLTLVIYAVITGPLVEELIYRGFTIGNGRPVIGKIPAIIIAAFAFGLMHGNLSQFVIGCLGGLVLGFIFAEYSIWWALLIHMINNGIGVVTMLFPQEAADLVTMVFYVIYGVFAVYAIFRIVKRKDEVKEWFADENNNGPEGVTRSILTSPWFIVFTVLYIAIIVLMMVFPELSMIPAEM